MDKRLQNSECYHITNRGEKKNNAFIVYTRLGKIEYHLKLTGICLKLNFQNNYYFFFRLFVFYVQNIHWEFQFIYFRYREFWDNISQMFAELGNFLWKWIVNEWKIMNNCQTPEFEWNTNINWSCKFLRFRFGKYKASSSHTRWANRQQFYCTRQLDFCPLWNFNQQLYRITDSIELILICFFWWIMNQQNGSG